LLQFNNNIQENYLSRPLINKLNNLIKDPTV